MSAFKREGGQMGLRKSHGNMYDWVTHVHSHLGGECGHRCPYCYVQRSVRGPAERYRGPVRLLEKELKVNYGEGRTIFVEHMNDLFGPNVKGDDIERVLEHCRNFPKNDYVFQTKNPGGAAHFWAFFPARTLLGTTIETNRTVASLAPQPQERLWGIMKIRAYRIKVFVTIEPIMDFDPLVLAGWMTTIRPEFVTIGADSKGCGLPEPSGEKVAELISLLNAGGVPIRRKTNLGRLLNVIKEG
jgi:DNA repair photolyase